MRRRLSYANVTATLALVFAMSGGALAANSYLINSTKQINPKVLKKLTGKSGKKGATGTTGATGPQGPAGKEGPKGEAGSPGKEGQPNPNAVFATKAGNAESATVANGQGTLASGHTEVGVFAGRSTAQFQDIPISFPIPLAAAPAVTVLASGATTADCAGSVASPTAAAGHLCVYENVNTTGKSGVAIDPATATHAAGHFGLYLFIEGTASSDNAAYGTWAVTAP
jgi:hypothetical protein